MKSHDYDIGGITLIKFVHLLRAVAASGNNDWQREDHHERHRYRLTGQIAGMKLHLVEDWIELSLRGDGWMVLLVCDLNRYKVESYMLPGRSGKKFMESSKSLTYEGTIKDVQIMGANAFKHDMTILLMFESQWES